MALKCVKGFSWAHKGIRVVEYKPGDFLEEDAELAPLAVERGWAVEAELPAKGSGGGEDASSLSNAEIRAALKERGVAAPKGASRKHLLELLAASGSSGDDDSGEG